MAKVTLKRVTPTRADKILADQYSHNTLTLNDIRQKEIQYGVEATLLKGKSLFKPEKPKKEKVKPVTKTKKLETALVNEIAAAKALAETNLGEKDEKFMQAVEDIELRAETNANINVRGKEAMARKIEQEIKKTKGKIQEDKAQYDIVTLRTTVQFKEYLKQMADEAHMSMAQFVRHCVVHMAKRPENLDKHIVVSLNYLIKTTDELKLILTEYSKGLDEVRNLRREAKLGFKKVDEVNDLLVAKQTLSRKAQF